MKLQELIELARVNFITRNHMKLFYFLTFGMSTKLWQLSHSTQICEYSPLESRDSFFNWLHESVWCMHIDVWWSDHCKCVTSLLTEDFACLVVWHHDEYWVYKKEELRTSVLRFFFGAYVAKLPMPQQSTRGWETSFDTELINTILHNTIHTHQISETCDSILCDFSIRTNICPLLELAAQFCENTKHKLISRSSTQSQIKHKSSKSSSDAWFPPRPHQLNQTV